jgi:type VI secretion system secreted protein Hcp
MAVDVFLKLDGIKGESIDDKHREEIVLESFSWGESNTGAHAIGTGAAAGKVSMQDFHFTSKVSKASPQLMLACATGQHIKSGQVTLRKTQSENQFEFLFYKFDTVVITSVQDAGATNDLPVEQVSFAFAKIEVDYKEQKADGSLGAAVSFSWNLAANRKD